MQMHSQRTEIFFLKIQNKRKSSHGKFSIENIWWNKHQQTCQTILESFVPDRQRFGTKQEANLNFFIIHNSTKIYKLCPKKRDQKHDIIIDY